MFLHPEKAPLQLISDPLLAQSGVKLYIKREDLLHPDISGNKWRKLKYNLMEAKRLQYSTILTFGGAYSNHISATAAAGKEYGFETIGIVRGEEQLPLNFTLEFAKSCGMQLIYWSRSRFRETHDCKNLNTLTKNFGDVFVIPEGGTNELAVRGTAEIVEEIDIPFQYICVPVGTGGTLAGLITGNSKSKFETLGFSSLKNEGFLEQKVLEISGTINRSWKILNNYNFGGYAKFESSLITFINQFKETNKVQLDPIYTGKMMFGIYELIKKNYFPENSTIVAIHTGGLQGILGFNERFGNLIK